MAALRDEILLGSGFEEKLNGALRGNFAGKLRCDRGAFLECYANSMMRFTKLTRHQRAKLGDVRTAPRCLAPAGGGKTFVAIQRALEVLHANQMVLFVSKNSALALFVVKWLVVASRTSARRVAARVRVLVAPFERGPLEIRVEEAGGRQRLAIGGRVEKAKRYDLAVVDEAHHLAGDVGARRGDVGHGRGGLVRSIADVPESAEVATVALREVGSAKRIVAGAAAFQLEAGRKAARGHSASAGPPLEARLFDGDGVALREKWPRRSTDEGGDGAREVPDKAEGVALERRDVAVGDGSRSSFKAMRSSAARAAAGLFRSMFTKMKPVSKTSQSIWDTSSCVSVDNSAELRFMPFSMVVDLSKLAELATLAGHSNQVSSVAVFPDGRRVVSGSWDDTVKVWDAATGECVATLAGHSDQVNCVAVFPDGRRVVSGADDNTVKVNCVAVFPDGRRVVSGSLDDTVKVYSVAVFPDGRRVASGSNDKTVKVWGC
ncbi:hypothetical protein JL720_4839 [Aureococcus anophagefferens]|nr:hypothetical protein JL720_4839 [Aureococcus anophagefferens]